MAARYSVIIPTLNEEKFLPSLLQSLAVQTSRNFEVIVVDGKSKDKTVAVAKKFSKKLPKLSVVVSTKTNLPFQRNLGAKEAKGDWFIFIDADSIVVPHFIERIDAYIKQERPGLFTTWLRPDSEDPREANIAALGNLMFNLGLTMKKPLPSGPLTGVARMAFEDVGGYSLDHAYNEDVDFCLRVSKKHYPIRIIPETLYVWSLRRLRSQGTLKVLQQYARSAVPIMLFNRPLKKMSGYVMGGQLYKKKKKIPQKTLKKFERRLTKLLKELFE